MPNARLMGSHANEALFHSFMPRTKSTSSSVVKLMLHHSLAAKFIPAGFFRDYITDSSKNLFSFILLML